MRPEWRRYLAEQGRYAPYFLWGVAAAVVFYAATTDAWHEPARFLSELVSWIVRAAVIGGVVFAAFAALYAVLTARAVRSGGFPHVPLLAQIGFGAAATCAGLFLAGAGRRVPRGALPDLRGSVFVAVLMVLVFFFHSAYRRSREDALLLRAAAAEARTQALERQMQPHFLFNALNSLSEMIESGHPAAAGTAQELADLYRRILAASKEKTSPLADELEIVKGYLGLEKVRFGERLSCSVDDAGPLAELSVPSLAVQTLVENAVRHGVARSREGGAVTVTAERDGDGWARVVVTNTGAPPPSEPREGTGLANTRERLALLFGEGSALSLAREGDRTVATFRVPCPPAAA